MAVIAFVGLGNMGAPMAANLVAAGHQVQGFDLAASGRQHLADEGGTACATMDEALRGAETLITMLPAGRHVREVLAGEGGAFAQVQPGTVVIECSTVDVETARAMHQEAAARDLPFLDAPVSGGITGAAAATLTFMVGGEAAALERVRPLLEKMGRTIVHAGGAGAGQAAKVCNNMILGISMVAVAEAFALADKLGLSRQALFDIASKSSGQCWSLTSYCPVPGLVPASPANKDYQAGFAAALMVKDMTLAVEAERQAGAPAVLSEHALAAYRAMVDRGWGEKDFSVVARALLAGGLR